MAHQRKTLKRFMDTILSRIPDLIKKYSPEEQVLLNEFLAILQNYDKADYDRKTLFLLFEKFNHKFYKSNQYARLPFLWFACTYFANAKIILSVARFHADSFKNYFLQQLRGNSKNDGVFNLLRKGVKLTDTLWEDLQYDSFKFGVPLSSEELQAIESIYSYIPEAGLHVLNLQRVKTMILNRVKSSKIAKNLPNIFKLLEANWFLRFHHPAFGIEQVVFNFQLHESSTLESIISFLNPNNTTLCTSNVYQVSKNQQKTFIGILRVPKPEVENLRTYLLKKERQGQLILHGFALVNDTRISCSLARYQAQKGWRAPTPTSLRRLALPLKTAHPRKRRMKLPPYFLSPSLNQHWNYLQENDPNKAVNYIQIYSKYSGFYEEIHLSKPDLAHLKELHENNLFHICFYSNRLLLEFSQQSYWIKMPLMPLDQLSRLLISLPYTLLFFTKTETNIWTSLPPELAQWMMKEFETWSVIPIIEKYYPLVFDSKWFDSESLEWKLPLVLRK